MNDDLLSVYIHFDMDAYYAQAEAKLLNIPENIPVCARQWNALIAINYPAREFGIKRCMTVSEAKKLCPQVLLPHVQTFRVVDGKVIFNDDKFGDHFRDDEKVSLQYYRDESKLFFNILKRYCSIIEKGGTDEAFLQLKKSELEHFTDITPQGCLMGPIPENYQFSEKDLLILRASHLAQIIRETTFKELKYRCSAGISFNKMLAKLASATNKPNKQTIILDCMLPKCISLIQIKKMRGFGGKVAETFKEHNIETIGQAQEYSQEQLEQIFYEKAPYIYNKLRGYDDEEVKKEIDFKNKSIFSLKNLSQTSDRQFISSVLQLVLYDISMRVIDFYEESKLVPTVLIVVYHNKNAGSHQKSEQLKLQLPIEKFKQIIEERAYEILNSINDQDLFPLIHIGIICRHFKPYSHDPQIKITNFIGKSSAEQKDTKKQQDELDEIDQLLNPQLYYQCRICGKTLNINEQQMHEDFHTAEELDRKENPNKKKYKNNLVQQQQTQNQSKKKGILQYLQKL